MCVGYIKNCLYSIKITWGKREEGGREGRREGGREGGREGRRGGRVRGREEGRKGQRKCILRETKIGVGEKERKDRIYQLLPESKFELKVTSPKVCVIFPLSNETLSFLFTSSMAFYMHMCHSVT